MGKLKFSLKRIAAQAGVSKATVDRVLYQRGSVRLDTERRVQKAMEELEAQHRVSLASGRTFYIDVVMFAPRRFSRAVEAAMVQQVSSLAPFRISPRFFLFEEAQPDMLVKQLLKSGQNGAAGVIVKLPDEPLMNDTVNQLASQGLPVVTLVTDLPRSQRLAYVGMDNRSAGETAAYLMQQWNAADRHKKIGVIVSSSRFRGEEEREMGFRHWLRARAPHMEVVEISGGYGMDNKTSMLVADVLRQHPDLDAIYSAGGGNHGVLDQFDKAGRSLQVFIGHDLDEENRQLLLTERISAIIDHDLQSDARSAFQHILQFHKVLPPGPIPLSRIQVVTPFNMA